MATAKTKTQTKTTSTQTKAAPQTNSEKAVAIVRETTERAVDVPVGAALIVADRVNEFVEPWTSETSRAKELKQLRTRVEREINKFERRGGTARRKSVQRVRQTRKSVERDLKSRRRQVETSVKQNRKRAETSLKKAQTTVQDRVATLV